jgi:predicted nucleic acid-binding protein
MSLARFLVDTSALARYADATVAARLDELTTAGTVATCGPIELQLLGVVQDPGTYTTVAAMRRAAFGWLDTTDADFKRALEVQALLVERGHRRVGWAVLIVAAIAERHAVPVVHCHPDYDSIAAITGQATECVVPI